MGRSRDSVWVGERKRFNAIPCKDTCGIVLHSGKPVYFLCRLISPPPSWPASIKSPKANDLPSTHSHSLWAFLWVTYGSGPHDFSAVFYKVPLAFAFRALNPAWVLVIHYNQLLLFFNQIYDSTIYSKCNFQMHLRVLAGYPKAICHKCKEDTFGLEIKHEFTFNSKM